MMLRAAFVTTILLAVMTAPCAAATQPYYYLSPRQLDLTVLLPPPPDAASAEQRSDEEQVAAAVAARSPAELLEAQEASKRSVFFFVASVAPQFTAQRLPITARFFSRVRSDVENLIDSAKAYWQRPRPYGVQRQRGSYPSGHAAFAASAAIILSQLIPSKRDAIFAQARTFAENRILLGLHYPSDVASGWTAGTLAAYVMMHDPAFTRDYAAAKAELARANL
ncbi:MAG: phosphatase PAP2 family protein [Candidatus Eremiobacteraeota bacterium]|nr:phosphatase PAP2 family protein [Candidatus Eremiobacteraeota bacterium]